jgi:transcriptional regulator with XRE-family HTH domain
MSNNKTGEHQSLGALLKSARALSCLTLRQVEEVTGISNAYLSQMENDKVKMPSINVLYKLSRMYGIDLDALLVASGIIEEEPKRATNGMLPFELTQDEEKQLLQYLQFLRSNKTPPHHD